MEWWKNLQEHKCDGNCHECQKHKPENYDEEFRKFEEEIMNDPVAVATLRRLADK